MTRCLRAALVAIAVLAAGPACRDRAAANGAPAAVTGLGAVPADAEAVLSFDVGRLAGSQLVERAVALLLQRDATLAMRWERLAVACRLDVATQVERVLLALGPDRKTGRQVLLVAIGNLPEATVPGCIKTAIGAGGGQLTSRALATRTLYAVTEGSREVWFGYGQPDTVVLGTDRAWVEAALGSGPKLTTEGALKALIARADQAAPIWAAGRPGAIGDGLVRVSQGRMEKGPEAVFGSIDPSTGLRVELGFLLGSEDDAKILETLAKDQLPTLALAAQMVALGPLVAKIVPSRSGSTVTLGMSLGMEEVNLLMVAIDRPGQDPQDSALPAAPPDAAPAGKPPKK